MSSSSTHRTNKGLHRKSVSDLRIPIWDSADPDRNPAPLPLRSPSDLNASPHRYNPGSPIRQPFGAKLAAVNEDRFTELLDLTKKIYDANLTVNHSVKDALFEFGNLAYRSQDNGTALAQLQDVCKITSDSTKSMANLLNEGLFKIESSLSTNRETQKVISAIADSLLDSLRDINRRFDDKVEIKISKENTNPKPSVDFLHPQLADLSTKMDKLLANSSMTGVRPNDDSSRQQLVSIAAQLDILIQKTATKGKPNEEAADLHKRLIEFSSKFDRLMELSSSSSENRLSKSDPEFIEMQRIIRGLSESASKNQDSQKSLTDIANQIYDKFELLLKERDALEKLASTIDHISNGYDNTTEVTTALSDISRRLDEMMIQTNKLTNNNERGTVHAAELNLRFSEIFDKINGAASNRTYLEDEHINMLKTISERIDELVTENKKALSSSTSFSTLMTDKIEALTSLNRNVDLLVAASAESKAIDSDNELHSSLTRLAKKIDDLAANQPKGASDNVSNEVLICIAEVSAKLDTVGADQEKNFQALGKIGEIQQSLAVLSNASKAAKENDMSPHLTKLSAEISGLHANLTKSIDINYSSLSSSNEKLADKVDQVLETSSTGAHELSRLHTLMLDIHDQLSSLKDSYQEDAAARALSSENGKENETQGTVLSADEIVSQRTVKEKLMSEIRELSHTKDLLTSDISCLKNELTVRTEALDQMESRICALEARLNSALVEKSQAVLGSMTMAMINNSDAARDSAAASQGNIHLDDESDRIAILKRGGTIGAKSPSVLRHVNGSPTPSRPGAPAARSFSLVQN